MATTNPYDRNNFPGKFEIVYEGMADAFHCFRIRFGGHLSMDTLMFRKEVSGWLFDQSYGEWFFGNAFGAAKKHPNVPFQNDDGTDYFVLLEHMVDVTRFEKRFPVVGFTPTLMA